MARTAAIQHMSAFNSEFCRGFSVSVGCSVAGGEEVGVGNGVGDLFMVCEGDGADVGVCVAEGSEEGFMDEDGEGVGEGEGSGTLVKSNGVMRGKWSDMFSPMPRGVSPTPLWSASVPVYSVLQ